MASKPFDEEEIFKVACNIQSQEARGDYLKQACGADAALFDRLAVLLRIHEEEPGFLESPPAPVVATIAEPHITEAPGSFIGAYKLLEQIGEGGFGVVFMAEQTQPVRRKVALKLVKPGMDTRQVVARFEAERQALAIMDHPNIAKVLDGGATATGRPYFVMDLVKGVPITQYCDENHLTPCERLELFVSVCQAVQHAHQKGIIHRDLKPSNVLVTMHDTTPVVKVIDFGVAKAMGQTLTDKTLFTGFAQMIGSPLYMSPEQAGQSSLDVDTRSDIYSLGVLLYELLTGTTPFQKERLRDATYEEIRRIVREDEPPRPSMRLSDLGKSSTHTFRRGEFKTGSMASTMRTTLASIAAQRRTEPEKLPKLVRGDLDWIVMKALEKDRSRRYETASSFAMDLRRYLADEPVLACPPSAVYRLRKFARRHKGPVWAAVLMVLVLAGGVIGTTWGMLRATKAETRAVAEARQKEQERDNALRERERATEADRAARHRLYQAKLAEAKASRWSRQIGQRFNSWRAVTEAAELARELGLSEQHLAEVRDEAIATMALADLWPIKQWEGLPLGSTGTVFDADLPMYARSDRRGNISVRSVADDRELAALPGEGPGDIASGVARMQFSPSGDLLAVRNWHQLPGRATNFQVWDWRQRTCVFEPSFAVYSDAHGFSPDGHHLALSQADGTLAIYEVRNWSEQKRLSLGMKPYALAFHPNGSRLAIGSYAGCEVQVRDAATGDLLQKWTSPAGINDIAWHPDGILLALGCSDNRAYLCDATTGAQHAVLHGHQGGGIDIDLSPTGDTLLSSAWDGTSRVWDQWSGNELLRFPGQSSHFSRNGLRAISRTGSTFTLMEVVPGLEYRCLPRGRFNPGEGLSDGGFSPNGRWLAIGSPSGVRLWDLALGKESALLPLSTTIDAAFHPGGGELYSAGPSGLFLWPVNEQAGSLRIGPPRKLVSARLERISFDRAGKLLTAIGGGHWGGGHVLDLENPRSDARSLPHGNAVSVVTSPNGQWVAIGAHNGAGVKVFDAHTGEILHHLAPDEPITTVGVSPDSRWLVIGTSAGFEIWETGSWQLSHRVVGEQSRESRPSAFSPDGNVLAIAVSLSVIQLIETSTWQPLARLQPSDSDTIDWLAFSPDNSQLAVRTAARMVRLWDLRSIREQLKEIGLDWHLLPYGPALLPGDAQPVRVEVDLGEYPRVTAAEQHFARAREHVNANRHREAIAEYSKGLDLNPTDAQALNNLAWCLVTCPETELRDITRAVPMAQKATDLAPENAANWNTLGVAHYYAGHFPLAIEALQKSELCEPDQYLGFNAFFLAMAHWQQNEKQNAHEWFDRAVIWMEKKQLDDEELRRFRAEASELLQRE